MEITREQEAMALNTVNAHARSLTIGACAEVARLKIAGLPAEIAVTVCLQGLLTAAVSLLGTARMSGDVTDFADDVLVKEVKRIQALSEVLYERQPDGTFSNPQAIN
jgi:hypothetical protein